MRKASRVLAGEQRWKTSTWTVERIQDLSAGKRMAAESEGYSDFRVEYGFWILELARHSTLVLNRVRDEHLVKMWRQSRHER